MQAGEACCGEDHPVIAADMDGAVDVDNEYGEEGSIDLAWGGKIRFPTYETAPLCDYVRIVDGTGRELVYWNSDEWANEPGLVMGAIMGLAQNGWTERWRTQELVPKCLLDAEHDVLSDSSIDCWACDLIRALYHIAIRVTDDPVWDAQMTLDDNIEWTPLSNVRTAQPSLLTPDFWDADEGGY
jgi:hypothetical protein